MLNRSMFISLSIMGLGLMTFAQADYYNQKSNNASNDNSRMITVTSTDSNVTDQDLAKKISDKLGSGFFSKGYENVTAQVVNGNVTLQGSVKTSDEKAKLDKEIRNMEGVKSLNSDVAVQDPSNKDKEQRQFPQDTFATSSDEQLNKKIRDNVSRGWLWDSYKEIRLNISNGVVTLAGPVDSVKDEDKLINEVQKVEGVKAVRSNLTIKNR